MRVLQLLAPAQVGGLERVVQGLASGLHNRGHEVTVAAVAAGTDDLAPFLDPLLERRVAVREIRVPHRAYLQEYRRIAEVCNEVNPDVLHTHGYRPDVLARGSAQRQGIATVTTVHGFTGNTLKNRLYEALQLRAFRRFDAVVAVSQPLRRRLIESGVPERRAWMIRNAPVSLGANFDRAEARAALDLPASGTSVGWVGRLSAEKGPDVLLNSLPLLDHVDVQTSFIGDGPERAWLEARVKELVSDGSLGPEAVRLHGTVADAGSLLTAFDVLVLSSRTEGTPMILFEAMAAGVPIVATRVGGVPDVLSGDEAVLVPSDDPERIAGAIQGVLDDPEGSRRKALRAAEKLRREFTQEAWLGAYEDLYQSVSAGHGGGA